MSAPQPVKEILQKLADAGFDAYLVGGCVRDLLLGKQSEDWDITTNARPEEIQKIFADSFYENRFGTVGVKTESNDPKLAVIEITTYRKEETYSDFRHPDRIEFASSLEEDLKRRDFTVNAMALSQDTRNPPSPRLRRAGKIQDTNYTLIDLFGGKSDLEHKLIRAVGDPNERFREDALRLMRAVRLATQLGFTIEPETLRAIQSNALLIRNIAQERIRDELQKILMAPAAAEGVELLTQTTLTKEILPELWNCRQVGQNKHHKYDVYEHLLRSLDYAAGKNYSLEIRLAALLHDIAKPHTKQGEGPDSTFHGHEHLGAKIARIILRRLRFSEELVQKVFHLVRYHMFYYNVGQVTEYGVRRFISRVGTEHIDDLLKLREADRIGSGVPKAVPYRLRHLKFMIENVRRDPVSPKMLAVNGNDVMQVLRIQPGPKVGWILKILLDEVLADPQKNQRALLLKRIEDLRTLPDEQLEQLGRKAQEKKEEFEEEAVEEIKKKYYV